MEKENTETTAEQGFWFKFFKMGKWMTYRVRVFNKLFM